MKKLFKGLELNENDNSLTALAKGGFKGFITYSAVVLPVLSTILIVGKCITNKEELKNLEEEMGAE